MQHLEINNILSDHQYGFCHSRSCETLLMTLLHDLTHCYDAGIQTDIILQTSQRLLIRWLINAYCTN